MTFRRFRLVFFPVILGVLLFAGGFAAGFYQAVDEATLSRTNTQIQHTLDRMRRLFETRPVEASSLYDLYQAGVLRADNFDGVKTFHPFSHHEDPSAIDFAFQPPASYAVIYKNLPRRACFMAATHRMGVYVTQTLYSVSITAQGQTTTFMRPDNLTDSGAFVPMSEAEKLCQDGADVIWVAQAPVAPDLSAYFPPEESYTDYQQQGVYP